MVKKSNRNDDDVKPFQKELVSHRCWKMNHRHRIALKIDHRRGLPWPLSDLFCKFIHFGGYGLPWWWWTDDDAATTMHWWRCTDDGANSTWCFPWIFLFHPDAEYCAHINLIPNIPRRSLITEPACVESNHHIFHISVPKMAKRPTLVALSEEEQKLVSEVEIGKTHLHQNQAIIVRCGARSLLWKCWSEQILKVSLKCPTSILSRTRSWTWKWDHFSYAQYPFHIFVLFLSFAKTMSGLWLLQSVVQPGHRFGLRTNWSFLLKSIPGDHLASNEQSWHYNGKSKGLEWKVSLLVEFSEIPRPDIPRYRQWGWYGMCQFLPL